MSSIWGENIRVSIFGESHGAAIGTVIDGLPPGIPLDTARINEEMERRRPGQDIYSTPRREGDAVEIVSGFLNGFTTGTPLCGIIRNTDKRSKDYEELQAMMRPGHADYTGKIRYHGFNDFRGGGHFSGRLTAPMVFAGAIAVQYLEQMGITIGTHLLRIGSVEDVRLEPVNIAAEQLKAFRCMRFPTIRPEVAEAMMKEIDCARMDQDSVGGVLETAVLNLPAGLGSPMFRSVESKMAAFVFSIPATKGIEFGEGFGFGAMRGSEANDGFLQPQRTETGAQDDITEYFCPSGTNHTGGINGGITNGMPVIFRTAFRPTPSISKPQQALDLKIMQAREYSVHGRHDPCVAVRAVPVMDAAAALVVMDLLLEGRKYK